MTLYTTCRPFSAPFDTIQRNAIQSWMQLVPRPQIILLGRDEGTDKVSEEFGLEHVYRYRIFVPRRPHSAFYDAEGGINGQARSDASGGL